MVIAFVRQPKELVECHEKFDEYHRDVMLMKNMHVLANSFDGNV